MIEKKANIQQYTKRAVNFNRDTEYKFILNVDVKVLSEAFCGLHEWAAAIQNLKVIIVLPRCSSSALSDPVPIIHSEHGGK